MCKAQAGADRSLRSHDALPAVEVVALVVHVHGPPQPLQANIESEESHQTPRAGTCQAFHSGLHHGHWRLTRRKTQIRGYHQTGALLLMLLYCWSVRQPAQMRCIEHVPTLEAPETLPISSAITSRTVPPLQAQSAISVNS